MKALMSDKLRRIIRDPKANQVLEEGISKLQHTGETETIINISGHQYKVKFVQVESK